MLHLYDKCPTATEYPFSCEECSHTNWAGNGLHLNDDGKHVERLVNMMMIDAFEKISDLQYQLSLVKTSCFKRLRDEQTNWDKEQIDLYRNEKYGCCSEEELAEAYKRLEEITPVQKGE